MRMIHPTLFVVLLNVLHVSTVGAADRPYPGEDWDDYRSGPCMPRNVGDTKPAPGNKWKCYCGNTGPKHLRAETCAPVPCERNDVNWEGNPLLQKQLRCMQQGAPEVTKEIGAWLRMGDLCAPTLTDETKGDENQPKVTMHCSPDDLTLLANIHTHPYQSINPNSRRVERISPQPSRPDGRSKESDVVAAAKCGVPVYVLTEHAIWRVTPVGRIEDRTAFFPGWDNKIDCK